MLTYTHGMMALSFTDLGSGYIGGLTHTVPFPIVVLAIVVVVIALFGMMSRMADIFRGKGTAVDFIGMIIMLMLVLLVLFITGSGVVRGINVM